MSKLNRIKSAILGGMMAAATVASSLTAIVPSMSASAAGSDDYAKLLQYSLYFYDANMCGSDVGTKSAMTWRDNCHVGDEVVGGFHDAGDHAMFGLPQGYTASTLAWSYYEFKDAYDATGQGDHLKVIMDHFCDFFKKSTKLSGDTVTNFLYQKEDGNKDHAYWGAPEKQEQEQGARKMYWTSNSASDIAADYAAALAANYINFGNAEDLKYAEALYDFSVRNNSLATDGPTGFYLADGATCKDEQAWAAGWLYLATKNEKYKNDCASKQTEYLGWVHGWNTTDLGAACIYAEITGDWSKVNSYIDSTIREKTQNGYLFMDKWGSARYNCSMQFTALVASKHSTADYGSWCKEQMNYITGNNPTGTCFVTGFASNSVKNAHHRAASGYQGYEGSNGMNEGTTTYHPSNGKVLIGALVGGPEDANGTYADVMNNYVANEVAIDYNAGLVGAAAGLYSVYKTGSTVSNIEGVSKIYNGSPAVNTTTQAPVTTTQQQPTTTQWTPGTTTQQTQQSTTQWTPSTTTNTPSTGNGVYETKLNQTVNYGKLPADDKMIGWKWSDLGVTSGKPTKVEIKISSNQNIGKWQGAFGSSTEVQPAYWTQTADMQQVISGNSGTITWDISAADSKIIQTKYGGELKFGIWWIDCQDFTIDSITVYTDGASSSNNTTVAQQTTTRQQQTTTQWTPSTTATPSTGGNGSFETKLNQTVNYGKLPADDKMIGWKWSDLGVTSGKPTKVEINISANQNIGKWQGAFGSSTEVQPAYWTQTADMQQVISGNKGTIIWDISAADSKIIQTKYGGELKFGIWWIDCQDFTIDSIKVYTDGASSSNTTTTVKQTTTVQTTTKQTTTVNNPSSNVLTGDSNGDGKVNIADATAIVQFVANPDRYPLTEAQKKAADCCNPGDGVTPLDAYAIQLLEAGRISSLPMYT